MLICPYEACPGALEAGRSCGILCTQVTHVTTQECLRVAPQRKHVPLGGDKTSHQRPRVCCLLPLSPSLSRSDAVIYCLFRTWKPVCFFFHKISEHLILRWKCDRGRRLFIEKVQVCPCSGYVSCLSPTRPKHADPAPAVICLPGFLSLSLKCVRNGSVSCLIGNNSRNCNPTIHPDCHISIWYYSCCIRECYFLLFFEGACFL